MNHVLDYWLTEEEELPFGINPNPTPETQGQVPPNPDPSVTNIPTNDQEQPQEYPDISTDPIAPDMPDEHEDIDFEQWKNNFFKESIKGDVNKLIDMITQVRDLDLDEYPEKFVEDNLQVLFLRQNSNIDRASKEIKRLIRDELDQNNPSVSVVNHINNVLSTMPELNNIFIKLKGMLGSKADLHRKFIAALIGGVQVGSGGSKEDVIYNERDYSIRLSTRYNSRWGKTDVGRWSLREDDPERYLTEPEQKRLDDGSPEEKEVLRRRVVIESIAETFKQRAFIVNVVGNDGTIYTLGWDIGSSLRSAYSEGKLVVRTIASENSEAMISDDGVIIPFIDLKIKYTKQTGKLDKDGKPELEEHDFLERTDGMLFLTAQFNIIKEASTSFTGIVLKELPYTGNPSDLKKIMRCVPSANECLMRFC